MLVPGQFELTHTIQLDLWGNEEDLFVSRLHPQRQHLPAHVYLFIAHLH